MITFWQAIILAVVQGLTEFLPISSTAHLILFPWLFNWTDPGLAFDVALHIGTLAAVLIYFFKTWVDLVFVGLGGNPMFGCLTSSEKDRVQLSSQRKLFWYLVLATFPAALAGWALRDYIATSFRNPVIVGVALIVVAIPMAVGERLTRSTKDLLSVGLKDSLIIGIVQATALIPGVSRSGATLTTALFLNLNRHAAARFSFLLSTPIIAGAALKAFLDIGKEGIPSGMEMHFLAGVIVSGVVGYAAIAGFLRYLQFGTLKIFIYYRVVLGIIVLALALL